MSPISLIHPNSGSVRKQAGFGLLEAIIGLTILAVALAAYVSTSLTHQRLADTMAVRSEVHQLARHFMERLRGDPEWDTLYAHLRTLQTQAEVSGTPGTRLDDGRLAYPLTTYYPEIAIPENLRSLVVLVDVPHATSPIDDVILQEDVVDAKYGLPVDLNGDGHMDADARDADYVALPVVVTFHWTPRGEATRELRLSTALRGVR